MVNKSAAVFMGIVLFVFFFTSPVMAKAEGITANQAKEIITELKQIRKLLENKSVISSAPAPQAQALEKVSLSVVNGVSIGKSDAPVTMVEFTDYQCPFCKQYHTSTFNEIQKNFVDTGQVRYISRDYPLPIHQNALKAAIAARCAGEQNRFWQFRHVLIVNSDKLTRDDILAYAKDLQLNTGQFTACLDSDKYQAEVQKDISDGTSVGVSGTPTFILGRTTKSGKMEGVKIVGAQPYAIYESKLRELLGKK